MPPPVLHALLQQKNPNPQRKNNMSVHPFFRLIYVTTGKEKKMSRETLDKKATNVLINPKLPEHFFDLDNGLRSPFELNEFWNVPIILTDDYQENDTWEDYQERTTGFEGEFVIKNESDFNDWMLNKKQSWFKAFPTGTAYRVYCLDGGCHDRPTTWGSFGSLDEAKACCENGPSWRRLNNHWE
jgi:hypothetical protein